MNGGIGALFRDHGEAYIAQFKPPLRHIKLIESISKCRTPLMGGRCIICNDCGAKHFIYHGCGDSHCMLCQTVKREQWLDKLRHTLLKVPYIHMTFTLPHELNMLIKFNKPVLYHLIQKVAWETVKKLSAENGSVPGMTTVLHTFGSDMKFHVHIHALVTYGGIDISNGTWKNPATKNKLAKYRLICATYKNLFLKALQSEYQKGTLQYPLPIEDMLRQVATLRWVVHSTFPTMDTKVIEDYLGRYINRVAITNNRLTYLKDNQQVLILFNNYKAQQNGLPAPKEIRQLNPLDAIHQILQHVLPPYYQKTRRYGLHHASNKQRQKLQAQNTDPFSSIRTVIEILHDLIKQNPYECSQCGSKGYTILPIEGTLRWILIITFLDSLKSPPKSWSHIIPDSIRSPQMAANPMR